MKRCLTMDVQPPKAPPSIEPTSKDGSSAGKLEKRMHLRFTTLARKAVPTGYIHIDKAMDEIGLAMFPNEWGLGSAFSALPFRYDKVSKKFRRHTWLSRGPSKVAITTDVLNVEPSERKTYRRWARQYSIDKRILRSALENGKLQGSILRSNGEIELAKKGIWATQVLPIFTFGKMIEVVCRQHFPARVLIGKKRFDAWIKTVPTSGGSEKATCGSAWKKDRVSGLIGVEQGPLIPMV